MIWNRPAGDEQGRPLLEQGSPDTAIGFAVGGAVLIAIGAFAAGWFAVATGQAPVLLLIATVAAVLLFACWSSVRTAQRTKAWDRAHPAELAQLELEPLPSGTGRWGTPLGALAVSLAVGGGLLAWALAGGDGALAAIIAMLLALAVIASAGALIRALRR